MSCILCRIERTAPPIRRIFIYYCNPAASITNDNTQWGRTKILHCRNVFCMPLYACPSVCTLTLRRLALKQRSFMKQHRCTHTHACTTRENQRNVVCRDNYTVPCYWSDKPHACVITRGRSTIVRAYFACPDLDAGVMLGNSGVHRRCNTCAST